MPVPISPLPNDAVQLRIITTPALWLAWPFLPLIRRTPGSIELGVLFDARGAVNRTGYSATVFLTCLFTLPDTVDQLLAFPREVYDTADELFKAGWRVD